MKTHVDLVPDAFRERAQARRRIFHWARLIVLLMILIALAALPIRWRAAHLRDKNEQLRAVLAHGDSLHVDLARLEGEILTAHDRYQIYLSHLDEPDWPAFFYDLAAASGDDLWLDRLAIFHDSAQPQSPAARRILLEGRALSDRQVVAFMQRLSAVDTLANLELKGTNVSSGPLGSVNFSIGSDLR